MAKKTEPATPGEVLKRMREERGLSKARLAREAGLSDGYLVQIEKGQRSPSPKAAYRLAAAMQAPPAPLLLALGFYNEQMRAQAYADHRKMVDDFVAEHERVPEEEESDFMLSEALDHARRDFIFEHATEEYWDESPRPDIASDPKQAYQYREGPEGWSDLTKRDQRLVQQLINRLRPALS